MRLRTKIPGRVPRISVLARPVLLTCARHRPPCSPQVGRMQVCIYQEWLPGYEYDGASNPPCFRSEDEGESIRVDDAIRLQIMKVRLEHTNITVLGTLAGDFLGQLGI